MEPIDFLDILKRQSFVPFRVHLTSGQTFDVRHSENAAVGLSVVWIYTPAPQFAFPLADREVVVSLNNIAYVEFLTAPTAQDPTSN